MDTCTGIEGQGVSELQSGKKKLAQWKYLIPGMGKQQTLLLWVPTLEGTSWLYDAEFQAESTLQFPGHSNFVASDLVMQPPDRIITAA